MTPELTLEIERSMHFCSTEMSRVQTTFHEAAQYGETYGPHFKKCRFQSIFFFFFEYDPVTCNSLFQSLSFPCTSWTEMSHVQISFHEAASTFKNKAA